MAGQAPAGSRIYCPRCGAGNFDGEALCWRCRTPLPSLASLRPPIMIAPQTRLMIRAMACTLAAIAACLTVWYTVGRRPETPGFPVPQRSTDTEARGPALIPQAGDQAALPATDKAASTDPLYNRQRVTAGAYVHTSTPVGKTDVSAGTADVSNTAVPPAAAGSEIGPPALKSTKEDPVVAEAQEAIARARLSLGQAGAISGISPTGEIRLKPGATLNRRALQPQQPQSSGGIKLPAAGAGEYLQPDTIPQ